MKLRTMRAVDYWIGIPLCFLCTCWYGFGVSPKGRQPRNASSLSSCRRWAAPSSPTCLQKVKDELGAEIFFLIFERNADSLRLLSTVSEANIITIRETGIWVLLLDSFRFLLWARKAKIDTVVDLELFSRCSAVLTGLSGAKRRVGFYRFHCEGPLSRRNDDSPGQLQRHIHIAKNFVCMINALLSPEPQVPYSKTYVSDEEIRVPIRDVSEGEKEYVRGLVREVYPDYEPEFNRIVLINPNSSELLPSGAGPRTTLPPWPAWWRASGTMFWS